MHTFLLNREFYIIALTRDETKGGVGDNEYARFVANSIGDFYIQKGDKVTNIEFNVKNISKLNIKLSQDSKVITIIIGVGDEGSDAIRSLKEYNIIKIILSHQISNKVLRSRYYANIIAISAHAISTHQTMLLKQGNSKLVTLIGVSSQLTEEKIKYNYQLMKGHFKSRQTKLGVLFGGDAKRLDGSIKKLTRENAKKIGHIIAQEAIKTNAIIYVTDGARTGAHLTYENRTINPVIKAFTQGVKNSNKNLLIHYYPFIYDKNKRESSPSAYQAIFKGCSKIFYTMDSIATGYELSIIKSALGKGIAIESESTTINHRNFALYLHKLGYISMILSRNNKIIEKMLNINSIAKKPLNRNLNIKSLIKAINQTLYE